MRVSKSFLGLLSLVLVLAWTGRAAAEQIWTVRSGVTGVYFNPYLLRDLKLDLSEIKDTAPFPEEMEFRLEEPRWSFVIEGSSDFSFRVDRGVAVPYGMVGGTVKNQTAATLTDPVSGRSQSLSGFEIGYVPRMVDGPDGPHPTDELVLRDSRTGETVFELENSMFDFRPEEHVLWIHYMNMRIADAWAARMGRPDLAGWTIGLAEIRAEVERTGGSPVDEEPYVPNFAGGTDVSLGVLNGIAQVGHDGTFPSGTVALSMATTSCNLGNTDVPWLAPMAENHPLIAMALYRQMGDRFEQIGISWMKHGFFALSNNDCSTCQHPSNGTFLGVGCSDTYGVNNNSDRNYLGPRNEVNPFTDTWTCRGSHFSGGVDDCVRRHGSSGHGPLDHRLVALDSDLNLPGATYFYEADYLVRDDVYKENNIGSRICTMTWNGSVWQFSTPSANNPLVATPAINRYGDRRTVAAVDTTDGYYNLAVKTTDLGGGAYHYEFALFNRNSNLGAHQFRLPIGDATLNNIGFHDSDAIPANDWQVSVDNGWVTWWTDDQETNPDANALGFGQLFNFRFDADRPPTDTQAEVTMFKPHTPRQMLMATRGPSDAAGVSAVSAPAAIQLQPCQPNPLNPGTKIHFALANAGAASLEVFDLQGRKIRTLVEGTLPAGAHDVTWDGTNAAGRPVESGVYYYRLRAGQHMAVQSAVVLR